MNQEELNEIIKYHQRWLNNNNDWINRIDFSNADLSGLDLQGVD